MTTYRTRVGKALVALLVGSCSAHEDVHPEENVGSQRGRLDADLMVAYSFAEGAGSSVLDRSGNGNNGSFSSTPSWVAGKYDSALAFDGSDFVSIGNVPSVNGATRFTLSAWVKRSAPYARVLLGKQTWEQHGMAIEAWEDGNVYFVVANGAWAFGIVPLNDTAWHHLALVFDGSQSGNANRLRGYVDGTQRTLSFSGTVPATTTTNTTPFQLGRVIDTYSSGSIDELRLYRRTLSPAEIQADMNTPVGAPPPAPDTSPPSVALSAPANGATVSNTITVSANASDNVGVVGVRFRLDGSDLGAEDQSAPYSVSWNTTSVTPGAHTLSAIARDAAGNQQSAPNVTVTVANAPPDTQAPSVPSNLAVTGTTSSSVSLSWSASSDNVGVTGYRVYRGATQVGTSSTTSFTNTGLAASTTYTYRVAAVDAAANASAQSGSVSATTQAPGAITGLDFPGTAQNTMRFRFSNPHLNGLPIYDATYIWRVKPRSKNGYFTTFFWGNDGNFWWDSGAPNTYYGAHPYPQPPPNGGNQLWEIAVDAGDYVSPPIPIAWETWHTQALRVWADSSGKHHEFYVSLPNTSASATISVNINANYGNKLPPSPALTFGDAPWAPGNEVLNGVLRGIQIYSGKLSVAEVLSEASTPLSTANGASKIWYLNMNPTPTDISDKSGKGHHPSWVGSERPALYAQ
jgi:hypothetical protein